MRGGIAALMLLAACAGTPVVSGKPLAEQTFCERALYHLERMDQLSVDLDAGKTDWMGRATSSPGQIEIERQMYSDFAKLCATAPKPTKAVTAQ